MDIEPKVRQVQAQRAKRVKPTTTTRAEEVYCLFSRWHSRCMLAWVKFNINPVVRMFPPFAFQLTAQTTGKLASDPPMMLSVYCGLYYRAFCRLEIKAKQRQSQRLMRTWRLCLIFLLRNIEESSVRVWMLLF